MGIYANNAFAPAIRIKSGIIPSGTLSITATGLYDTYSYSTIVVNFIDPLDQILTTGLSGYLNYTDLSASKINNYAFYNLSIANINMPNVTSIGSSAFYGMSFSNNILFDFPNVTSIGDYAFARSATSSSPISYYVSLNLPNVETINQYCFASNYFLSDIDLPKCSVINGSTFARCYNLSTVKLNNCTKLSGNYCFSMCSLLTSISLPKCSYIGYYCFHNCRDLSTISLPACTLIGQNAFQSCCNLLSLYLNVSAVPSLSNTSAFYSTPIGGYTGSTGGVYGSIFVPTSLYSSFISATNWANYSSRIVSMNF